MNLFTHLSNAVKAVNFTGRFRQTGFCFAALMLITVATAVAQTFPANFTQVAVATGLTNPTVVTPAPDGRLFVGQQGGSLRVVKNGTLLTTPFISLTVDSNGERGLLGIAFDPDFTTNNYVYLYYTVPTSGTITVHNRVSRFRANGDLAVPNSETVVLELNALSSATNHNGGSIVFGSDRKLYVAAGENANINNSQTLDNYLGKVMRINTDGSVPSGNPFSGGSASQQRIWAYGLRNPYTLSVQPGTGRLFINDVGQSTWEEINDGTTGGLNFGWPTAEGNSSNATFTNPVYEYAHGSGDGVGCAITGGTFYSPPISPYPASYAGKYFFQDFCSNWINVLDLSGTTAVRSSFATGLPNNNVSITLHTDGYLYYLNRSGGALYKIVYLGETCQTVQAGNWHNSAVWSCGHVPIVTDRTVVRHAVTIETSSVGLTKQAKYESGGQLLVTNTAQLRIGL